MKIKLDPTLSPYKLSRTLTIPAPNAGLINIQFAEIKSGGDLYIYFATRHYLKTGEIIKVDIPSMPEIAQIQVECNVVNSTVIRVNYAKHQVSVGAFRNAYSVITFENALDQDGNQLSCCF